MMPVLQGYTNDGLLMNNFGPESDWRHKRKLLLSTLIYYARYSAYFLSCRACNSGRPNWRLETWKVALGTLLKGLVRLSVCACLRATCKGYSASDVLAM